MMPLNFIGEDVFMSASEHPVQGQFFGQSSFAARTLVKERSVVNLSGIVDDEEELKALCPLGCGVQTGCGTMINVGGAKEGDEVAVLGVGSVGLSAVMVLANLSGHFDSRLLTLETPRAPNYKAAKPLSLSTGCHLGSNLQRSWARHTQLTP